MPHPRTHFLIDLLAPLWRRAPRRGVAPPSLPPLEYQGDATPAAWLPASMTTFAESVASFLPGHHEAYARIYHPFDRQDGTDEPVGSWRALAAAAGVELRDAAAAEAFAREGVERAQAEVGRLSPSLIRPLVEHLRRATTAPERCYFAVWEGFGDSVLPHALEPTLELPNRRYHLFSGPIEGALTSFSDIRFGHRSANLWWPADRAWRPRRGRAGEPIFPRGEPGREHDALAASAVVGDSFPSGFGAAEARELSGRAPTTLERP